MASSTVYELICSNSNGLSVFRKAYLSIINVADTAYKLFCSCVQYTSSLWRTVSILIHL